MAEYQRASSNYVNSNAYSSNNSSYHVSDYSDTYNSSNGMCRGTCKLFNQCTCGSKK